MNTERDHKILKLLECDLDDIEIKNKVFDAMSTMPLANPWMLGSKSYTWLMMLIPALTGLLYQYGVFASGRPIEDWDFVALLCGATFLLGVGMYSVKAFLASNLWPFYASNLSAIGAEGVDKAKSDAQSAVVQTFEQQKTSLIFGIAYGSIVSASVFVLNIWDSNIGLNLLLASFMWAVNFVTGVAFVSLYKTMVLIWRLRDHIQISIWHRRNRSTEFVDTLRTKIAVVASGYTAISLTSIVCSKFPPGNIVYGYSIFAGFILVLVYVLPGIWIRRRVKALSRQNKEHIDSLIHKEFNIMISKYEDEDDGDGKKRVFDTIDSLMKLRKNIDSVSTPSVSWRSARTVVYIVFTNAFPSILSWALPTLTVFLMETP
jgi:hypothetical protein